VRDLQMLMAATTIPVFNEEGRIRWIEGGVAGDRPAVLTLTELAPSDVVQVEFVRRDPSQREAVASANNRISQGIDDSEE
jgi:hypothetical protein